MSFDPYLASPTTQKIIMTFIAGLSKCKAVIYDTISSDAALNAFQNIMESRAWLIMTFQSKNVLYLDADFLGDWQGGGYAKGYAKSFQTPHGVMVKLKCLGIFNLNPTCP